MSEPSPFSTRTMEKRERKKSPRRLSISTIPISFPSVGTPVSFDRVDQENLRGDGLGPTRRGW